MTTLPKVLLCKLNALAEGHPEAEVRALRLLAVALSQDVTPTAPGPDATQDSTSIPSNTSGSLPILNQPAVGPPGEQQVNQVAQDSSQTPGPLNMLDPSLMLTSTPTNGAPFVLQDNTLICNIEQPDPLIQVQVKDAVGQPVPSVELVVLWEDGQDHFFTGLQPELGLGYGDFLMSPGTVYSVQLANGGQAVNDLTASECVAEDGSQYWGSWMLTFTQP